MIISYESTGEDKPTSVRNREKESGNLHAKAARLASLRLGTSEEFDPGLG